MQICFPQVKAELMHADVSHITEHLAYQFNITGEAKVSFILKLRRKLYVEPYEYFDRDVIFTCTAKTLEKIARGSQDPVLAFTLGKLKVDGNFDKALKLKDIIDTIKK